MSSFYKEYKGKIDLEILIQCHLIKKKIRKIAFVKMTKSLNKHKNKICIFLDKIKIKYVIDTERLILCSPTFDISSLDKTYGKKFAEQLGEFYVCATDNFRQKLKQMNVRIVILVNNAEIFAQMCSHNDLNENYSKIFEVYKKLYKIIKKLDQQLFTKIEIYYDA